MRIVLKTGVRGHYLDVMKAFDRRLFEALTPANQIEIIEFTGSKPGDKVHLRFKFPLRADWVSLITEYEEDDEMAYFVDVGEVLPGILSSWRHKHLVQKIDNTHTMIVDDIQYEAHFGLLSLLIYPAIYLGFYPRKKIYRTYFQELFKNTR